MKLNNIASPKLIKAMKLGLKVVLLSDAGTPTISDPGYKLVSQCVKEGITIESLPGPCALITALAGSGMPTDKFTFLGYLSRSSKEKIEALEKLKNTETTGILYEASNRIVKSLEAIETVYGKDHSIYIGNELTKLHEAHFYGTVLEVTNKINDLNSKEDTYFRGESTIVISPYKKAIYNNSETQELNSKLDIGLLDISRKLNENIKINARELKDLLVDLFALPKTKAEKISSIIKNEKKDDLMRKKYL